MNDVRALVAPELRAALEAFPVFDITPEFIAYLRSGGPIQASFERPPLTQAQQRVRCEERRTPGLNGAPDVRMLVYTPAESASAPRPAVLHMHGGGYVLGNPELNDASNRSLASELNCVVVSADYRLAPETVFPGALEDCYAALLWLHRQAGELGVDASRIAVKGESAGGGHAAALAIHARNRGEVAICLQVLDSPMLDDRTGSAADPDPGRPFVTWSDKNNRFGWASLLGFEPGGPQTPEGAAPARVADVSNLPPAFILVGALDLFAPECLEYARRLMRAGVPVEAHVIPGAFHGFGMAGEAAPQVRETLRLTNAALARAFYP